MADRRRAVGAQASLERVLVQIAAGINARALYGPSHPSVTHAIQRVLDALATACDESRRDAITFLLLEDEFVVDEQPLRRAGLSQRPVIHALKRRGIQRLTLSRGLETAECSRFLEALAVGGVPPSTVNVIVGQVKVAFSGGEAGEDASALESASGGTGHPVQGGGGIERAEGLSTAEIGSAMEAFLQLRRERRAGLRGLEGFVWSCVDALSRTTRAILPLAPLKEHDQYTFVHSVNVSLLVLAHARSFGIQGEILHSIGLAALLHDVGKLSIPLAILNKPGRLEDEEWKVMMSHAELGARHLCEVETSATLPVLVAYEHHLRFDGQQSYPTLRMTRRPTLASQLTALADVYDAICTTRPYRKAQSQRFALDVLRSRAGTFHDPFLVGDFCRLLGAE